MKKILLLLLLTLLSEGTIFAFDGGRTPGRGPIAPPEEDTGGGIGAHTPGRGPIAPPEEDTGGGIGAHTPGRGPTEPTTPIDTNKAVLVITAVLLTGAMGYKKIRKYN